MTMTLTQPMQVMCIQDMRSVPGCGCVTYVFYCNKMESVETEARFSDNLLPT